MDPLGWGGGMSLYGRGAGMLHLQLSFNSLLCLRRPWTESPGRRDAEF
jgi:hypothetical protein